MKKSIFVFLALFLTSALGAENFTFKYETGQMFKASGLNKQKIYIDGVFQGNAITVNKITWKVLNAEEKRGLLDGNFYYIESRNFDEELGINRLLKEYNAQYWRDSNGVYKVVKEDYVPVVRNVPTFPNRDLKPGDRWSAPGEEYHDLREDFLIDTPLKVSMTVDYQYIGPRMRNGKMYHLIRMEYEINTKTNLNYPGKLYPNYMAGQVKQDLYWDSDIGQPFAYEEEYAISWRLTNGRIYDFTGFSEGIITEMPVMNREDLTRDIKKDLLDKGLGNVDVRPSDKGVTITLDNIQFEPESNLLKSSEMKKLDTIGEILKKYPKRDILIEGHTALAGTKEGRQQLSEDRASAVGNYLYKQGVRSQEQMLYKGHGAEKPIADNSTEAGMAKNRRVEITILEN